VTESRWVFLRTLTEQPEGVTHYTPLCTLCERTVAEVLLLTWRAEVAKIPGSKMAETTIEPTEKAWLDLGGMAKIDRKIFTLEPLHGLTLEVPAQHVANYIDVLKELLDAPREKVGERLFVTIPSRHMGIFLTVSECIQIGARLTEILAEAEAIATIENDEFNKMIAKAPHVVAPKRPVGPMGDA